MNDPDTGTTYSCGLPPSSLYQSFTPSRRALLAVDVPMRAGGSFPAEGVSVTIGIREGNPAGRVVGQATTFVAGPQSVGARVVLHFDFTPALGLDPQGPFVLQGPALGPAILSWFGRDGDPYAGGTSFGCVGNPIPTNDFNFITYLPGDVAPPDTSITAGPNEGTVSTEPKPRFEFTGSDDLSYASRLRFECALDGAEFVVCSSPLERDVADGRHRFAMRAIDETGQIDPTPSVRSWIVDTTPPRRPRVLGPRRTSNRMPTYRFLAFDAVTPRREIRFRCSFDTPRLKQCRNRFRKRLKPGRHVLRVKALDGVANQSELTKVSVVIRRR